MSRDSTVLPFRQPEAIDDPLSELAREGARRMLAQVLIAEAIPLSPCWKDLEIAGWRRPYRASWPWAGIDDTEWDGAGRGRGGRRCATGAARTERRESASPRRSCRSGRGGRRASMRCCRFCTCVGVSTGDFREALAALLGKDCAKPRRR